MGILAKRSWNTFLFAGILADSVIYKECRMVFSIIHVLSFFCMHSYLMTPKCCAWHVGVHGNISDNIFHRLFMELYLVLSFFYFVTV